MHDCTALIVGVAILICTSVPFDQRCAPWNSSSCRKAFTLFFLFNNLCFLGSLCVLHINEENPLENIYIYIYLVNPVGKYIVAIYSKQFNGSSFSLNHILYTLEHKCSSKLLAAFIIKKKAPCCFFWINI